MGDFIRKAFKLSGIDEKMEKLVEETILREWSDEFGVKRSKSSAMYQNIDSFKNDPNLQLVTERILRRLERIYENKLQNYRKEEEKKIEEKVEKLKLEYKNNLEFAHSQHEEKMRKKEEEFRRREELLKEENHLEFEKQQLELERAWNEVEASKKDIRVEKEHLEVAKSNFSLKIRNMNLNFQRQRDEIAKESMMLEDREKELEEKIKIAVEDAKKKERDWIVAKVKEWNLKEAKLTEKCEILYEKIRISSKLQAKINEQASTIRILESDISCLHERLSDAETKLKEAQNNLRKFNDYEIIKEENNRLQEELLSKSKDDVILSKDAELASLRRKLKLVEETADLRIKELKLKLKFSNKRLQETMNISKACQTYGAVKSFDRNKKVRQLMHNEASSFLTLHCESNTSPSASSSSFDQTVRDRLKSIEKLSKKLDISVAQYQSRNLTNNRANASYGQLNSSTKGVTASVSQPLMTSTPKSKKKFSLRVPDEESSNSEISVVQSNVEKNLDEFQETALNRAVEEVKNSSARCLNFGDEIVKKEIIKEFNKSVQQLAEEQKSDHFTQNARECEEKNLSIKDESDGVDFDDVRFDPKESDEAHSEAEW